LVLQTQSWRVLLRALTGELLEKAEAHRRFRKSKWHAAPAAYMFQATGHGATRGSDCLANDGEQKINARKTRRCRKETTPRRRWRKAESYASRG
jgi:hypothetical protein